ncbi:dienelactone hydrolase endo-1,3,1,4-beta-D-glucanase [Calocera viscosa TUFC12733]|uniref:Dienelactone hydrolase endo-1,3,1,4-beta-D-glucanase n=1 Tax=Calocera viscosa (strain TUFC12733) TaxID=1330018 RepID=A0A167LUE4_CALVF|nr:dienelactone hydrolase endo-1,3,1,4-beta-D-glucanase [Calocera viscosa TUFC12733]
MKLCADCVSGSRLPGTPQGSMIKVGSMDCYYAPAPQGGRAPTADKNAILLFTDIFGLPLENPKIMADSFAKETGLDVYVPDMFDGRPVIKEQDLQPYDHYEVGVKPPLWKNLGFTWQFLKGMPNLLTVNWPSQVCKRLRTFVETLKKEKGLEKVGAVGYCYGGQMIAELSPYHLLSSAVICHPGDFSLKLVTRMDFPLSWVVCEEDFAFEPKKASEAEQLLAARVAPERVDFEFRKYMGTRHGFACRPALDFPVVKKAFEDASDQTVEWFKKTLL